MREFYFGLFTGLVVLGVTSLIGVVVVSLSITDEMDVCAALLPEPVPGEILTEVMIARFNEAGCADHSTRLMRPLIAGGGAMLLYFCAGLWTRLSYRKRKGGSWVKDKCWLVWIYQRASLINLSCSAVLSLYSPVNFVVTVLTFGCRAPLVVMH